MICCYLPEYKLILGTLQLHYTGDGLVIGWIGLDHRLKNNAKVEKCENLLSKMQESKLNYIATSKKINF